MRIAGQSRVYGRAAGGTSSPGSSGAAFRLEGEGQVMRQAPAPGPAAAGSLDALGALMALQEVDDALTGRRKAVRRGHALLDSLEEIRADLVIGRVSEGRLNRAMALLQQARVQGGEALDAVVADIELRVRVELAKLGRYPAL